MSTSITQHHVTGIEVKTKAHAIGITVNVVQQDYTSGKPISGELEIDLYSHNSHDPLAPTRLDLLKQLSEAATAAYDAERAQS